jgi:hypothetical protein
MTDAILAFTLGLSCVILCRAFAWYVTRPLHRLEPISRTEREPLVLKTGMDPVPLRPAHVNCRCEPSESNKKPKRAAGTGQTAATLSVCELADYIMSHGEGKARAKYPAHYVEHGKKFLRRCGYEMKV